MFTAAILSGNHGKDRTGERARVFVERRNYCRVWDVGLWAEHCPTFSGLLLRNLNLSYLVIGI